MITRSVRALPLPVMLWFLPAAPAWASSIILPDHDWTILDPSGQYGLQQYFGNTTVVYLGAIDFSLPVPMSRPPRCLIVLRSMSWTLTTMADWISGLTVMAHPSRMHFTVQKAQPLQMSHALSAWQKPVLPGHYFHSTLTMTDTLML